MAKPTKKYQRIDQETMSELDERLAQMKAAGAPSKTGSKVTHSDYLRSRAEQIKELKELGFSNQDIAEGLKIGEDEVISASTISYATKQAGGKPKGRKKTGRKTTDGKQVGSGEQAGYVSSENAGPTVEIGGENDGDKSSEQGAKRVMAGGAGRHESTVNPFE